MVKSRFNESVIFFIDFKGVPCKYYPRNTQVCLSNIKIKFTNTKTPRAIELGFGKVSVGKANVEALNLKVGGSTAACEEYEVDVLGKCLKPTGGNIVERFFSLKANDVDNQEGIIEQRRISEKEYNELISINA